MEFIKLDNQNQAYCEDIYDILKCCGEDMYQTNGLKHWLNPYPMQYIKNDIETKSVFIVKENEKTIATFSLTEEKSNYFSDNKRFIYLSKFAVHPNESRRGLGRVCLEFMENLCRKNRFEGIRLDVYDKSYPAVKFYLKNGFEELFKAKTKNFDVICMEKRVK